MADSLFFLGTFFGVTWLCVWAFRADRRPKKGWAPFDMVDRGEPIDTTATTPRRWMRPVR